MADFQVDQARGKDCFRISGDLSFTTVPEVFARSMPLLKRSAAAVSIDLQAVERSDSAGLALLVEWLLVARRLNKAITFRNIPTQMRAIAQVSALEAILPLVE